MKKTGLKLLSILYTLEKCVIHKYVMVRPITLVCLVSLWTTRTKSQTSAYRGQNGFCQKVSHAKLIGVMSTALSGIYPLCTAGRSGGPPIGNFWCILVLFWVILLQNSIKLQNSHQCYSIVLRETNVTTLHVPEHKFHSHPSQALLRNHFLLWIQI